MSEAVRQIRVPGSTPSGVAKNYLRELADLDWHSVTEIAAKKGGRGASGIGRCYSNLVRLKLAVFQAPDFYAITKAGLAVLEENKR